MHPPQTPEDLAIVAWYESQTEETLRDLQDRHGADTPRQAWEAFTSDCLPPTTNATGESLAAPALGGQGAGTNYLRCLRRASLLIARISAFRFSFSALSRRLSVTTKYVLMAAIAITNTAPAQTKFTIESTEEPFWLFALSLVLANLLAVVIFHWVLEPLHRWIVEKLS